METCSPCYCTKALVAIDFVRVFTENMVQLEQNFLDYFVLLDCSLLYINRFQVLRTSFSYVFIAVHFNDA